ncbi:MAG: M28 family peptidase [Bacillota bacterium]
MKKINYPLLIGTAIIVLILLVSLFPERFSDVDPYGRQAIEYNSETATISNPVSPPSKEFPWGTDFAGRDLKSLIVYGCKLTMLVVLFVALGRLAVALPIAIYAAYGNKLCRWLIKQSNIIFGALPIVLLVVIWSRIWLFNDMFGSQRNVLIFLLILFGWSKFAKILAAKVQDILQQDFVEGEIAIGKTSYEIAFQNILPHLIPTLVVMLFMEMAAVLLVLTQLGAFGIIFAGGYEANFEGFETASFPFEFDWSDLLAGSSYIITSGQGMWVLLYPAVCFAGSIIGFNLFGEGLRMEFEKRDSMVISYIRRIPSAISPFKYIYQLRNFKLYKSSVYKKSIAVVLILAIIFFPQKGSAFNFDSAPAFNTIDELSGEKYNGRKVGTEYGKMTAEYVAGLLEEYGIKPYNGSYLHDFEMENRVDSEDSTLMITGEDYEYITLRFRTDYMVLSDAELNESYEIIMLNNEEVEALINQESKLCENKIVLLDARELGEAWLSRLVRSIKSKLNPKGIILVEKWISGKYVARSSLADNTYTDGLAISLATNIGDTVLKMKNPKMKLTYTPNSTEITKGYNVAGYIEGSDESLKNEVIVVGSAIDYIGNYKTLKYPGAMAIGGTAIELEIARTLTENDYRPKRTIIFVFWDGTYAKYKGSTKFIMDNFKNSEKQYINFDLRNFVSIETDNIIVDTTNISPVDRMGQDVIKEIKTVARKKGVQLSFGRIRSPITEDMNYENKSIISFDSTDKDNIRFTTYDSIERIDKKLLDKVGQMILDVVVYAADYVK